MNRTIKNLSLDHRSECKMTMFQYAETESFPFEPLGSVDKLYKHHDHSFKAVLIIFSET
ncbi:conserved hypothetical protein [Vibrio harveyi]|nr:conserved hypothetical protein [Vibrio harveyi]